MRSTFIIVLFTFFLSSYSQKSSTLYKYRQYKSLGKEINGVKVGKWYDISLDSVIYLEGLYDDNGNPDGLWTINYPDGAKRKTIRFENGHVTAWSYFTSKYVIGVTCEQGLPDSLYLKIDKLEIRILKTIDEPIHTKSFSGDFYIYSPFYALLFPEDLADLLALNKFTGTMISRDDLGRIMCERFFTGGKALTKSYEYKKGVLRSVMITKDGRHTETEVYDKSGKFQYTLKF